MKKMVYGRRNTVATLLLFAGSLELLLAAKPADQKLGGRLLPPGDKTKVLTISTRTEYPDVAFNEENQKFIAMVSAKAPYFKPENRAPIDMIVVLDQSGSMSGERISLAKQTLEFVVENLTGKDRLGVVLYSNTASTLFPLTKMDAEGQRMGLAKIKGIRAGGMTALCAGAATAIEQMRRQKDLQEVSSVLLFTDGQANVGKDTTKGIMDALYSGSPVGCGRGGRKPNIYRTNSYQAKQVKLPKDGFLRRPPANKKVDDKKVDEKKAPAGELPATVNTFGFGAGHNEALLASIAEKANGSYYYVKNADMIGEIFADCLGGLISTVGQRLRLTVTPAPGVTIKQTLAKKVNVIKSTTVGGFESHVVELGDIQSEENRDIQFVLDLPKLLKAQADYPLLEAKLTYFNVLLDKEVTVTTLATVKRSAPPVAKADRDSKIDEQYNRWLAKEALDEAQKLADKGNLEDARQRLDKVEGIIRNSPDSLKNKGWIKMLKRSAAGMASMHSYQQSGSKNMRSMSGSMGGQRSSGDLNDMQYETAARAQMKSAYRTRREAKKSRDQNL